MKQRCGITKERCCGTAAADQVGKLGCWHFGKPGSNWWGGSPAEGAKSSAARMGAKISTHVKEPSGGQVYPAASRIALDAP